MTQTKQTPIRLPILIGVSGQRRFAPDDPQEESRLRDQAQRHFSKVYDEIDRRFPHSPKVVITGGAAGADLIAAEAALQRPEHWHVAILLPFAREFYEEDFDAARGFAADLETLNGLLDTPQARVTVKTLPLLQDDCGIEKAPERLSRNSAGYDRVYRHMHYEQVGQWIAEAASIFIAVTAKAPQEAVNGQPSEGPAQANGSTARIIEVRRRGRPDAAGMAAARQSAVLRQVWPTIPELAGEAVWRIDPSKQPGDDGLGIEVLEPYPRTQSNSDQNGHAPYNGATQGPDAATPRANEGRYLESAQLKRSPVLARAFDRFNASFYRRFKPVTLAALPDNPCDALRSVRTSLSKPAARTKGWSTRSFAAVTLLFLAAVTLYEVYAKIIPGELKFLVLYVFGLGLIWTTVYSASRWHLQSRAEDYRAVSELLRIQRAWWASGLPNRVDREHLQGADPDLAAVRNAVTSILSWVWLKSSWPSAVPAGSDGAPYRDWDKVYDPTIPAPRPDGPDIQRTDWIPEQARYFSKNHHERETLVRSIDAISWFFFVAGGLLAALVLLWKKVPGLDLVWLDLGRTVSGYFQSSSFLPAVWAVLVLTWLQDVFSPIKTWAARRTFMLSLLLAMSLALLGWSLGHILDKGLKIEEWARKTAIFFGVFLPALAGAIRYYSEKRGFEAEALQYREAQGWFARAWAGMEEIEKREKYDGDGPGSQADQDRQAIVLQLGRLALKENEAWLKTRRERPLTPVSG